MVQYILGIDEGTTSARAFVIDDETNIRGFGQAELTQLYPRPGSIEHDPMEILSLQLEVIRAALRDAGIRPDQLSVAGLTNQRETAVVWDKDSGPADPQRRGVGVAADGRRGAVLGGAWIAPLIRERTGLIPDAFYSARKFAGSSTASPTRRDAPSGANCWPAPSTRGSSGTSPAGARL